MWHLTTRVARSVALFGIGLNVVVLGGCTRQRPVLHANVHYRSVGAVVGDAGRGAAVG